jgi:hypothetical protein
MQFENDDVQNDGGSFADQVEAELLSDVVAPVELEGYDAEPYIGNEGRDLNPLVVVHGSCPECGHQSHRAGACLNAASDNDCDCQHDDQYADETDPAKIPLHEPERWLRFKGANVAGNDPDKPHEYVETDRGCGVCGYGQGAANHNTSIINRYRDLETIKLIPGYQLFKDAYKLFMGNLATVLTDMAAGMNDDQIAVLFKQQLERKATQNQIDATREWADQQGAIRPSTGWVPLNDSGHDFVKSESGTLDQPLGQLDVPVAPANSETEVPGDLTEGELMVLQTEKTIRELQADVERLEQESIRNSDAVLHWSEVSDMFNTFMAEDGVEATSDPLTVRIAAYVSDLRDRSFRLAGLEK